MNVIVITGASDGIGAEMARQWAAREKSELALVLAARNIDKLETTAAACRAHGERGAMSVEQCARLIIEGTIARKREIVMSAKGKLGRRLKLIAPGVVDRIALRALRADVRPR